MMYSSGLSQDELDDCTTGHPFCDFMTLFPFIKHVNVVSEGAMKRQWPLFTGLIVALAAIFCIAAANLNRVVEWTPYAGEPEEYTWTATEVLAEVEADSLVEEARFVLDGELTQEDQITAPDSDLVLEMELKRAKHSYSGIIQTCDDFFDYAKKHQAIDVKTYSCTLTYRGGSLPLPPEPFSNFFMSAQSADSSLEDVINMWMSEQE